MFWRVAICHLGIRGQICLGSDPEKMELERESLINRTKIKLLFEKNEVQKVLDDSWKHVKEYDITQKLEEIDEKYGSSSDPAKLVLKWVKKLELEMEE